MKTFEILFNMLLYVDKDTLNNLVKFIPIEVVNMILSHINNNLIKIGDEVIYYKDDRSVGEKGIVVNYISSVAPFNVKFGDKYIWCDSSRLELCDYLPYNKPEKIKVGSSNRENPAEANIKRVKPIEGFNKS